MRYLFIFLIFFINVAKADVDINFSGFGTLGVILSDSSLHGFRLDVSRDNGIYSGDTGFKEGSLLGAQLELSLSDQWQFIGQFVYKDRTEQSFENSVELAFLRFNPSPAWSIRAGRMGLDLFMMTEYRNIGFAYPWTHPPTEFYGIIPNENLEGVDVTYTHTVNKHLLRTKIYYGKSDGVVATDYSITDTNIENIYGVSVEYELEHQLFRFNYTQATAIGSESAEIKYLQQQLLSIPSFIWPEAKFAASALTIDGLTFDYATLGYRFDNSTWLAQAEVAVIKSDGAAVDQVNNGYVYLARHFHPHTFYLGFSVTDSPYRSFAINQPEPFQPLAQIVEQSMNFFATKQQTYSMGWRWDFTENFSSKIQWDLTSVTKDRDTLWLNDFHPSESETINIFSANISFVF